MNRSEATPQPSERSEGPQEAASEARLALWTGEASSKGSDTERSGTSGLMDLAFARENMERALKKVKANRGGPGVDGMTVDELPAYLREHWPRLKDEILRERYRPQPVQRRSIPKSGGGTRELGIPCVVDRFIQQALLQVLQARFDKTFSEHSYGFRPGRSAHDAVRAAQRFVQEGREIVVDVDLEKFFDRVNHDVLMGRLAKRIGDRRVLVLIRKYLEAGIMVSGVVMDRDEGTPQGGPLSPFLANVLLDEVDKALEKTGHTFVRYADDCNVYVRSMRAGERVMGRLRKLFERLRLQVNEAKSAVDLAANRKLLGFTLVKDRKGRTVPRVADKALRAFENRVREVTARTRGRSMASVIEELRPYLIGWRNYFRPGEKASSFEALDGWIRRRLRMLHLHHWKSPKTAYRAMLALGATERNAREVAAHVRRWWHTSKGSIHLVLTNGYFDRLGLPRLVS